jgi:hypothetical protein
MSRPEASERPGGSPVILAAAVINYNGAPDLVGYLDAVRLPPRALRERRGIRAGVRVPRQEIRHWDRQHSYRRQLVARARRLFRAPDGA